MKEEWRGSGKRPMQRKLVADVKRGCLFYSVWYAPHLEQQQKRGRGREKKAEGHNKKPFT